ncbi:uncharacterized protein LOC132039346 [Lycium ferocissimum]|uniref:uncharacterized protein LOC132039346 n=1 Tax=Lycium ferocissimum TaxID=112874 RepID=UPI002816304F|nr:uncharacterized protein LOC132039346 [Lycium ferocissimum]
MILRTEDGTAPLYDSIHDASKISIKVTHGGVMKHQPRTHYSGGRVQFIDHVHVSEVKLSQFKIMAEICGYGNDSVAFWHKYGRLGEKMRLVSTDLEVNLVSKNIPEDRVIEVCFEHLDSYIGMDVGKSFNAGQNSNGSSEHQQSAIGTNKEGRADYSSSSDDFEDLDNDFSNEHDILGRSENGAHRYEVSDEVRKKMAREDGDSDCVNSEGFKSLESDSNSDSMNFPKFNPKTDGLYPVLALELIFKSKKEFKEAVRRGPESQANIHSTQQSEVFSLVQLNDVFGAVFCATWCSFCLLCNLEQFLVQLFFSSLVLVFGGLFVQFFVAVAQYSCCFLQFGCWFQRFDADFGVLVLQLGEVCFINVMNVY